MKVYEGVRICETLSEIVEPQHSCLVVWDVQNGLVGRVFDKDSYVSRLKPFVTTLRRRMPILYTMITPLPPHLQSGWTLFGMMRRFGVDDPAKLANFMAKGSPEREIPIDLAPEGNDIVVEKATPNLFVGTNVELILRNRGVRTLVFVGIATEAGIETSARDASARGFYPVVVRDGVSSPDRDAHERSLKSLERAAIVATMGEVLTAVG